MAAAVADRPGRWHCKRCNHDWDGRTSGKPLACPKCKSYAWDIDPAASVRGEQNGGIV